MNDVPLLKHIEAILEEHERKRAALREADREWLKAHFEAAEKALELTANAYPTVEDFNNLRLFVREEFAKLAGRNSLSEKMWRTVSVVALLVAVIVAIFTYYAPAK